MTSFRTEHDFLGEKKVPANAYFGIHTQRSLENFSFSKKRLPPSFLHMIFEIKKACCHANLELSFLDKKKAQAIVRACDEGLAGKFDAEFDVDLFQSGSGTSTHMNVNEVIANRATELLGGKKGQYLVHPNDDVNMGQSTNDVIPTATKMACLKLIEELQGSLEKLALAFEKKEKEFRHVVKSGRTHLQDAVPVTLGQEFGAYAACTKKHAKKISQAKVFLLELAIGGNAIGTGLNTHPNFRKTAIKHLQKQTGNKFVHAGNGLEQIQFFSDVCTVSATVQCVAVDLLKISGDLKLLASGPKTGFGEIILPAVEPGSSIMPGKVNPSIPEAVSMACIQTISDTHAVTLAASGGQLELNAFMPLIAFNLIESIGLMDNSCKEFTKMVLGTKADEKKCAEHALWSPSIATALNPVIGYEKASEVVKHALRTGKTVKEAVVEKGYLSKAQAEKLLDPKALTSPNLKARK